MMESKMTENFLPKILKVSSANVHVPLNMNHSLFHSFLQDYLVQSSNNESGNADEHYSVPIIPISETISNTISEKARAQFCNLTSFLPLEAEEFAQRRALCSTGASSNNIDYSETATIFENFSWNSILQWTLPHYSKNDDITSNNYRNYSDIGAEFTLTIFRLYLILGLSWFLFARILPSSHFRFLKKTSEFLLSHLTFLLCLPLLGLVTLVNYIIRRAITLVFHIQALQTPRDNKGRRHRKYSLLAGVDSFWAYDVFANSTNFFALYVLEGESDLEKIQRKIHDNVIKKQDANGDFIYKRLEFRIVTKFGYYCWENEGGFDIRKHVKYIENLKEEGKQGRMTEAQVFEEMGKLCNVPCSSDKPQWEILVVPNYVYDKDVPEGNPEGKKYYGLIYRFHHSYLDGVSAGHTLQNAMADIPPSGSIKMSVDTLKEIHVPLYKKILLYVLCIVVGPLHFFQTMLLNESNCFHGPVLTGPKRLGWSKPVDLEALKVIKEKTRTTTTAVLLSCLGSSVRNLAMVKGLEVPDKIHAFITIAMLPYKSVKPQNRFTLTLLPLTIGLDNALDRLKAAYKSALDLSRSPDIFLSFHIIRFVGLFPTFVGKFVVDCGHATILLSNVPGPKEKVFMFDGDRLVDAAAWAPIKGSIGIGMSLFSYAGRVRCTMVTDNVVLSKPSDTSELIHAFETAVTDLSHHSGVAHDHVFIKDN